MSQRCTVSRLDRFYLPMSYPTTFTFDWFTVAGNPAGTPADTLVSSSTVSAISAAFDPVTGIYSGSQLWPGASSDPNNPDWPGWKLVNGSWVPDPLDFGGNLRPSARVQISVNPTNTSAISYPPPTPQCYTNPPAKITIVKGLTKTGADESLLFSIAGALLLAGALVVTLLRRQHTGSPR